MKVRETAGTRYMRPACAGTPNEHQEETIRKAEGDSQEGNEPGNPRGTLFCQPQNRPLFVA